ncbi:MAG TPA: hypothetical protein VE079_21445 [Ensifer sp.]|nr:hypothetical protein [Ensifer sp.]
MRDLDKMVVVGSYKPSAIYFQESDCLEYVRHDVPNLYRRIDEFLTLILSMEDREPIGFSLKGFRNFYIRKYAEKLQGPEFRNLVRLIEEIVGELGDDIFDDNKRIAYRQAIEIAKDDEVQLNDLPQYNCA